MWFFSLFKRSNVLRHLLPILLNEWIFLYHCMGCHGESRQDVPFYPRSCHSPGLNLEEGSCFLYAQKRGNRRVALLKLGDIARHAFAILFDQCLLFYQEMLAYRGACYHLLLEP